MIVFSKSMENNKLSTKSIILFSFLSSSVIGLYSILIIPYEKLNTILRIIGILNILASILFLILFTKYYKNGKLIKNIIHKYIIIFTILMILCNISYYFSVFEKSIFKMINLLAFFLNFPAFIFVLYFTLALNYYKIHINIRLFLMSFFLVLPNIFTISILINKMEFTNNIKTKLLAAFYFQSLSVLVILLLFIELVKYA
jgi:hypothetical protein